MARPGEHKILRHVIEATSYLKFHAALPRRTINQCRGIVTPVNAEEPPKPVLNAAKDSNPYAHGKAVQRQKEIPRGLSTVCLKQQ
jgi:hypothetical protein